MVQTVAPAERELIAWPHPVPAGCRARYLHGPLPPPRPAVIPLAAIPQALRGLTGRYRIRGCAALRSGPTTEIKRCHKRYIARETYLLLPDSDPADGCGGGHGMHDEYDELAPDVWTWLQAWYVTQCDGEWEHEFGVKVETVDNPGWSVDIDIAHTSLAGKPYERQQVNRSQHDWVITWEEDNHFRAACGPLNLGEALHTFRRWADQR